MKKKRLSAAAWFKSYWCTKWTSFCGWQEHVAYTTFMFLCLYVITNPIFFLNFMV